MRSPTVTSEETDDVVELSALEGLIRESLTEPRSAVDFDPEPSPLLRGKVADDDGVIVGEEYNESPRLFRFASGSK